jgi:hypothetical protein
MSCNGIIVVLQEKVQDAINALPQCHCIIEYLPGLLPQSIKQSK